MRANNADARSSLGSLGDEFAAEGASENSLHELFNVRFRLVVARFERIGGFEACFDMAYDFLLFSERREPHFHCLAEELSA